MTKTIIVCVPKAMVPNWPEIAWENSQDRYVESTCDDCSAAIWLGVNSKVIHDAGGVIKCCVVCAVYKHGASSDDFHSMIMANPPKDKRKA